MDLRAFCEMVTDEERMQPYMGFVAAHVIPYRKAFFQMVHEVLMIQTFTLDEWMNDELRRRYGWPQAIEGAYQQFIKEYHHE